MEGQVIRLVTFSTKVLLHDAQWGSGTWLIMLFCVPDVFLGEEVALRTINGLISERHLNWRKDKWKKGLNEE